MSFIHALVLFFFQFCLWDCNAFYFLVGGNGENVSPKCFNLEQPRDTPLVINYEILDAGHSIGFDLYYGDSATQSLQILHKVFSEPVGHVEYTTDNSGLYSFCLQQVQQQEDEKHPTRFKLNIYFGYDADYYDQMSKEQKYDTVNMETHKLNDMLTMSINEADYQKHKEVDYHIQTERVNSAALWWPMIQIGILVITGIFQVQHLKSFFKQNKLI